MASLHADVLFTIFMMNATDETECTGFRLNTTRHCSQVCRSWRNVLLDSPLIWGRVLLIDENTRPKWLLELLRRTGSSPLCIQVVLGDNPMTATARENVGHGLHLLFGPILFRNWHRLESLEFTLIGGFEEIHPYLNWHAFLYPAPLLRSCIVMHRSYYPMKPFLPGPLFANDAPVLHTFSSNIFPIPQGVPSLRVLTVQRFSTISELLSTLKAYLHLERLTIQDPGSSVPVSELKNFAHMNLPFLNSLAITLDSCAFIAFMNHFNLPGNMQYINCSINVRQSIPSFVVDQLPGRIGRIFDAFAPSSSFRQIGLSVEHNGFELTSGSSFSLGLSAWPPQIGIPPAHPVAVALRLPILDKIMYLSLRIYPHIPHATYNTLDPLLVSMSAVTHLDVTESFFTVWIRTAQHTRTVLFPKLHTIYVDRIMVFPEEPQPEETHNLVRFLQYRKGNNCPISVMHSNTKPKSVEKLHSMFFDISGLRITWNDTAPDGRPVGHTLLCKSN